VVAPGIEPETSAFAARNFSLLGAEEQGPDALSLSLSLYIYIYVGTEGAKVRRDFIHHTRGAFLGKQRYRSHTEE
jgi:hypothetical protein